MKKITTEKQLKKVSKKADRLSLKIKKLTLKQRKYSYMFDEYRSRLEKKLAVKREK